MSNEPEGLDEFLLASKSGAPVPNAAPSGYQTQPDRSAGQVLSDYMTPLRASQEYFTPDIEASKNEMASKQAALLKRLDPSSNYEANMERARAGIELGLAGGMMSGGIKDVSKLPMDMASRMARAKEMGFDTSQELKHGTNVDIKSQFRDLKDTYEPRGLNKWGKGNYFAHDIDKAKEYGDIIHNVYLKNNNLLDMSNSEAVLAAYKKAGIPNAEKIVGDAKDFTFDKEFSHFKGAEDEIRKIEKLSPTKSRSLLVDKLRNAGYQGIVIPEEGVVNVFDPTAIRSIKAEFNPKNADSKNILAGGAAAALLGKEALSQNYDPTDIQGYAQGGLVTPPGLDDFLSTPAAMPTASNNLSAAPAGLDQFIAPEMHEAQFGTPLEQAKTFGEGAASAATFGLSSGLENALLGNAKEQRERRIENPIIHGTGQVAGLVGSSFIFPGGGAAGLLERAGAGGAEALGLRAAEEGARLGMARAATRAAVKGAIEGSLVESGNEVSKMFQSDPDQTAQTAISNIGLTGVLSAGIGGVLGSVSPLWEATAGKKISKMLGNVADNIDGAAEVNQLPGDYFQKGMFENLLEGKKGNAYDIAESASRLGVKPTTGMLSDSPGIQNLESELGKRLTIPGQMVAKESEENFKALSKAGLETFRDATNLTEAQVGKQIKEGMTKALEERLTPLEESYQKLQPHFKNIEIPDSFKKTASQSLLNDELVRGAGNTELGKAIATTAKSISEDLGALKNVDDLKNYRTLLNKKLQAAYRTGAEDTSILQKAKNLLTDMREQSINQASMDSGIGKKAAKKISDETIGEIRSTDKAYAEYKKHLKSFGVEAGLGNVNDARQLLERFGKLSDESFAKRIFDIHDINQMKFFQESFPEQFDLARRYKLKEILENSVSEARGKNGQFDVSKFLNQISDRKMNPEARDILFAGNAEKIKDIRNVYRSMPANFNTSNTAAALQNANVFSPQYLLDNVTDTAKLAILKSMPYLKNAGSDAEQMSILQFMKNTDKGVDPGAFQAMNDYVKAAIKGENNLSKAAKEVFKSGSSVLPAAVVDEYSREKLDKRLKELQTNNNPLFDIGGKTAHYLPDHGSAIAATAVNAVQYLNAQRPTAEPMAPLDGEFKVDKAQLAKFNVALDVANNPISVFPDIKNGSITPHQIDTLKTLYPALYARTSQKLINEMVDAKAKKIVIPYKTKLGLSLYLGQPLDSTMTPQGIQSHQPQMQQPPQQPDAGTKLPGPHSLKDIGKIAGAYQTPLQAREANRKS